MYALEKKNLLKKIVKKKDKLKYEQKLCRRIKTYFIEKTYRNKNHPLCHYVAIKPPPDTKQTEKKTLTQTK